MLRGSTFGLMVGAGLALAIALTRFGLPTLHGGWALIAIAGSACIGLLAGAASRRSESEAARLVDEHYDLKDRSITTLQFASESNDHSERDAIRQLQIDEAQQHLQAVDPSECVPLKASRTHLGWASGLAAAAMVALLASSWLAPPVIAKSVLPLAKEQSNRLRETMLPELEKLAEDQDDPEIKELVEELKEQLDELDERTMDETDLLATLSEMEQSLADAREAMQLVKTDATMTALAHAMKPSDQMRAAAEAMESKEYDKASEELEAIDPSEISDKQRRAVSDNMKKMLSKLSPGQQGTLSDTIMQLAEGMEKKNESQCKQCMSKLAKACKKQGQCNKICQCMSNQLNKLAECKSQCRGQCQSNVARKSNSPSTKAGKASSGKPLGEEATQLDSHRNQEHLSGVQGEGPSETEVLEAPEGEQKAARAYAAKYDKFKRQAESVLDSEPLPMGHRETVRKYFESIRPNGESDSKAE